MTDSKKNIRYKIKVDLFYDMKNKKHYKKNELIDIKSTDKDRIEELCLDKIIEPVMEKGIVKDEN